MEKARIWAGGELEAGVMRKVGGGMYKNIEVSTASWSGGNAKNSPQKN
jgi:hypothetical protein